MLQAEALRDALSKIDMQLAELNARKAQLLQGSSDGVACAGSSIAPAPNAEYQELLGQTRSPVHKPRVVYQGEPGAYSEMAARNFFGKNVCTTGLYQFEDAFQALARDEADYAVLPIENSCTGAIRQVYDLLERYPCFVVGETTVQVNHALMALPGTGIEDITTVYSHEQGLMQCESFLASHPQWQQIVQADTAGSARMVAELGNPHVAAICSVLAAEIYGLEILQERINRDADNTTRFFVLSPKAELRDERNKICIAFTGIHNPSALQNILTALSLHNITLVHLESRPVPGQTWTYMYFMELIGDLLNPQMEDLLCELSVLCADLRVLGNYRSGF